MCRTRPKAGFTLVELMIVTAIIAILIAILAPTVKSLGVLAKRTLCSNSLHQYSTALLAYTADRGVFPSCHGGGDLNVRNTWLSAVYDYGSREKLAKCPAIEGTQSDYGTNWNWAWDGHHNGYGYNMWFLGGSHDPNRQNEYDGTNIKMDRDVKITQVLQPHMCLMLADSNVKTSGGADYGCTISLFWPFAGPDRYREGVCGSRHLNMGVTAWVDGHIELIADPDNTINPPYCGARKFLEFWDRLQRVELGK